MRSRVDQSVGNPATTFATVLGSVRAATAMARSTCAGSRRRVWGGRDGVVIIVSTTLRAAGGTVKAGLGGTFQVAVSAPVVMPANELHAGRRTSPRLRGSQYAEARFAISDVHHIGAPD